MVKPPDIPVASAQTTRAHRDGYLETVLLGRVTPQILAELIRDGGKAGWSPSWLIDARTITGFSADSVPNGVRVLSAGKDAGLRRIVIITTLPAARMAARTIGLAAGVELHVADSASHASELLLQPLR